MRTELKTRPWDVSAAAAILALIGIAAVLAPHDALIRDYPVMYNVVFGVGAMALIYWILIRLWWIARQDRGPSTLIAASIALRLGYNVYSELWNALVSGRPFQQPLDLAMEFVHVAAGVCLAIAFLKWSRIPDWLAWLFVAQVAIASIEAATGLMLLGDLPVTAGGLLWTVCLGCLAVVLATAPDVSTVDVGADAAGT